MKARDIMSRPVITVGVGTSVRRRADVLFAHR